MLDDGTGIKYRIGTWSSDQEEESSNLREFANLIMTLEEEAKTGLRTHSVVIMATDNTTVETCIFKGNSTSRRLYDLVVRIRDLELKYGIQLIITHVSGKRMKS